MLSSIVNKLTAYRAAAEVRLESGKVGEVLARLSDAGWIPAAGEASFAPAELSDELSVGANALGDPDARAMLVEISKAGFIRASDLSSRWSRRLSDERTGEIVTTLKGSGLLTTKHLLVCRADGSPLTEFEDPSELQNVKARRHPSCGRQFESELLQEGYSVSALGRPDLSRAHEEPRGHLTHRSYSCGMTARVGAKGQVVIPKAIRDRIGIHPGDEVDFELRGDDEVVLVAAKTPSSLRGRFGGSGMAARLLGDRKREPR